MTLGILGLGTAVPVTRVTNPQARQIAQRIGQFEEGQDDFVQGLYDHVGIRTRYTVLPEQVIHDVLGGTNASGSPFVTALERDLPGPTTRERLQDYVRRTSLGRLGSVDDVVTAIEFLSASTFTNGTIVQLDGGLRL